MSKELRSTRPKQLARATRARPRLVKEKIPSRRAAPPKFASAAGVSRIASRAGLVDAAAVEKTGEKVVDRRFADQRSLPRIEDPKLGEKPRAQRKRERMHPVKIPHGAPKVAASA